MKNRSIAITLALILLFSLIIAGTVVAASFAYFGASRTISGKVNLSAGIRVDFGDDEEATIYFDETNETFYLLSYDVTSSEDLNENATKSKLDLSNIRPSDSIFVVNPEMRSLTSDSFYVRARVKYTDLENVALTTNQLNEIFGSSSPINFGSDWLFDNNGDWAYFVGSLTEWTNSDVTSEDLKLVEENDVVSFFDVSTVNNIDFVELNVRDDVEHFSVEGVIITLQIQAVEESAVYVGFFS